MHHNRLNSTESGRTLLETIMVLAVMGVLTILGITMGRKAHVQYTADKTVQEVGLYAVQGAALLAKGQTDLSLNYDNITDYDYVAQMAIDTENTLDTDSFYVRLSGVPEDVCALLKEPKLDAVKKVVINPNNCSNASNELTFYFTGDVMEDTFTKTNPDWQDTLEEVVDVCDTKSPYQGTDGECYSCDDLGDLPLLANDCARCPSREMWDNICVVSECGKYSQSHVPYEGSDGVCYACSDPGALPINADDCSECEKREMWDGLCVESECGKYSNAKKPYTKSDGTCYACAEDYILNDAGTTCVHCPDTYIRPMDEDACRCPDDYGESSLANYYKENVCLPYCTGSQQESGLVFFVDRSGSTSGGLYKYINSAMLQLNIPSDIKTGLFDFASSYSISLPYGYNSYSTIKSKMSRTSTGGGTVALGAVQYTYNNICTGKEKLLMMMWTDGYISNTSSVKSYLSAIMAKCPGSKFYYVGLSSNPFSSISTLSYNVKSLPSTYANSLIQEIYANACISK